jgi:hypothetical protein
MDPMDDIIVLDITASPVTPVIPGIPSADEEGLLCFKCHKSNAKLMRFECHCDLPVHVECAIYLKRKGYTCPLCNFTKDMRQVTPESRLLPRNESVSASSSSVTFNICIVMVIVMLACLLSYIIYNYAVSQRAG